MLKETYAHVRVRRVILVVILGVVVVLGFGGRLWPDGEDHNLEFAVLELMAYGCIGLFLWNFWGQNFTVKEIFGSWPNRRDAWIYLTLGIPMVGVAFLGIYLLFWPLSYVAPTFVSEWLLDTSPPTYIGSYSLEAIQVNGLIAFNSTLLAPIVEEVVFRGFILHRWCKKYGEKKAIVLSSILFGVLHSDMLGGVVFAVIVSVVCLRTKSLVGPILIHIGNNSVIVLWVLLFWLVEGPIEGSLMVSTIEEFQSTWWYAPIGMVIGVPWLCLFMESRLWRSNSLG